MADRTTNHTEAAESTLSSALSVGATTINVTDTSSFPAVPFYVTIDPGDDSKRETVYVDSAKTGTTFTLSASSSRGQGSTGDVSHDSGARIIHGPTASAMNDLHDRIDADQADFDAHDHDGTDSPAIPTANLTGHDKAAHDALTLDHGSLSGLADFATDHGTEHDAHDHSAAASTIASADLADHNKATHDALGIDAATLDGNLPAAFAAIAGDTFTGAVTVQGLLELARSGAGSNANLTDGTGLVQIGPDLSNNLGLDGNEIQSRNGGAAAILYLNAQGGMVRMGTSSPLTVEVDGYTEVASYNHGTSATYSTAATVNLTIPSDWSSWRCFASVTYRSYTGGPAPDSMDQRLRIDGTDLQEMTMLAYDEHGGREQSRVGYRSGMTTTGSRAIELRVNSATSGDLTVENITFYARAVRTS